MRQYTEPALAEVACPVPSHYANQCSWFVKCTLEKLELNLHQIAKILIEENALENAVCKMAAIISGLCVLNQDPAMHTGWIH